MRKTTLTNETTIGCSVYGNITGVDCGCLQDKASCSGCFIYDTLKQCSISQKDTQETQDK